MRNTFLFLVSMIISIIFVSIFFFVIVGGVFAIHFASEVVRNWLELGPVAGFFVAILEVICFCACFPAAFEIRDMIDDRLRKTGVSK